MALFDNIAGCAGDLIAGICAQKKIKKKNEKMPGSNEQIVCSAARLGSIKGKGGDGYRWQGRNRLLSR